LLWVGLALILLGVAIGGPRLIGYPHFLLALLSLPVLAVALVGLPHLVRDPLVRGVITRNGRAAGDSKHAPLPPGVSTPEFGPSFSLVTETAFRGGNQVEVLANGDQTFERLWQDLRGAERSVSVRVYYAAPGLVADTLSDILAARAQAGVDVYFLYDAFGAADLPARYFQTLHAAGVHTAAFRPVRWYALDNASHRLHVRGIVIDGRIGYTGGFGIDDKWLGSGRVPGEWRETNVRVVGPVSAQLQAGFVADWSTATGELLVGGALTAPDDGPGAAATGAPVQAAVVRSPPLMGSSGAERLLALAIASARQSLLVSNPYFIPTRGFARLLVDAALRGVDVRVLTNGAQSDVKTTWRAGRSSYERLLRAGVRIYEYRSTLHAKTFVVDGALSAVTTMNFDNRSLAYNSEVALVTCDPAIGVQMESLFFEDSQHADEIIWERFRARPRGGRVLESIAKIGSRML
jgi:cardiolipin synthase